MTRTHATPSTGTVFTVMTVLLLCLALGSIGFAGATSAQEGDGGGEVADDVPEYNLEFEGEGTYAFGSPGITERTMTEVFDQDMEGFNGSVYAFDESAQRWERIDATSDPEVESLSPYVVVLDKNENASTTIRFKKESPSVYPSRDLIDGFNFVTATRNAEAINDTGLGNDGFETTSDIESVRNDFDPPTASPGDIPSSDDIDGDDIVNPFAGYFIFSGNGTISGAPATNMTQSEVNNVLNVDQLRSNISYNIDLDPDIASLLDDNEDITVDINATADGESTISTATLNRSNTTVDAASENVLFGEYNTNITISATDFATPEDYNAIPTESAPFDVQETGQVTGPEFTVEFSGGINGTVTNSSSGAGLEGASVNITNTTNGEPVRNLTTDSSGDYETTLPSGNYNVTVDQSGFDVANKSVTVVADTINNTNFELQPVGSNFAGGSGTDADPYKIANWNHLNNTRVALGANFTLVNDLNATTTGYDSVVSTADGGFAPIGTETSQFKGTFDGDGNHIDDLYINQSRVGASGTGLFGTVELGLVSDVTLENASVSNPANSNVGVLVGRNYGTVTGSSASGNVSGSGNRVGGLVGLNADTIEQSNATVDVTGPTDIGGLVGSNTGEIADSYATGNIENSSGSTILRAGGLSGGHEGTITRSYATGDVNGVAEVGGLVGLSQSSGTINESYATGNVTGDNRVGGFIGANNDIINESYATGNVSASDQTAGGLVGANYGTVNRSHATGTVSSVSWAGGLVGASQQGEIIQSYATGNVTAETSTVGGLVGITEISGTVNKSYATGDVAGNTTVGGLVGNNNVLINESYATGNVSGDFDNVGGLVGYHGGTIERSYAAGSVSGGSDVGGLVGFARGFSEVNESYWDTERTKQTTSTNGTALTTSEMTGTTASSNMGGFDFSTTWETVNSSTAGVDDDGYPILQTLDTEPQVLTPEIPESTTTATVNGTIDIEDTAPDPENGLEVRIDIQNDNGTEVESQTVNLSSNTSTADYSFDVDPANFSGSSGDSDVLADINRDNVSNDEDYELDTSGDIGDDTEAGRALGELNASETQTEDFTVLEATTETATINGTVDIEDAAAAPQNGSLTVDVFVYDDTSNLVELESTTLSSNTSTASYSIEVDPAEFNGSSNSTVNADIDSDSVDNDDDYTVDATGQVDTRDVGTLNASEVQTENFTILAAASDLSVTARNATADGSNQTVEFNGTLNEEVSALVGLNISQEDLTAADIVSATPTTNGTNSGSLTASGLLNGNVEINATESGEFAFEVEFSEGVTATEELTVEINDFSKRVSEDANATDTFSVDTTASTETASLNGTVDLADSAASIQDGPMDVQVVLTNDTGTEVRNQTATLSDGSPLDAYNFTDLTASNFSEAQPSNLTATFVESSVSNDADYALNASQDVNLTAGESAVEEFTVADNSSNSATGVDIQHATLSAGARSTGSFVAEDIKLTPATDAAITFGSNADFELHVTNTSGKRVIIVPDNGEPTIDADEIEFGIYNGDGTVVSNPVVRAENETQNNDADINVTLGGNTSMFAEGVPADTTTKSDPFGNYTVSLVDNSTGTPQVINSTEERQIGIGYNIRDGIQQNSTSGTIEFTIPREVANTGFNDSWYTRFSIGDNDEFGPVEVPNSGENFTVTVDSSTIPEGNYTYRLEIFRSDDTGDFSNRVIEIFEADEVEITSGDAAAPAIFAPEDDEYDPDNEFTIGTFHNATGVIGAGDVAVRLVNATAGNGTVVATNESGSVPVEGDVNTTIPADELSGDVTVETQLYNTSNTTAVANDTINLTAATDSSGDSDSPAAPTIFAPEDDEYDPDNEFTIGTFHNATSVIDSSDVAVRLVNATAGNGTVVATNASGSVPVEGDVNTTIPADELSGNVTVETQLYNTSNTTAVANDTINLTAAGDPAAPAILAPDDDEYDPTAQLTFTTFHNATGVISDSNVAVRLLNATAQNGTEVALNDAVPVEGEADTTVSADELDGNVTLEAQLYNLSSGDYVANVTTNLTAVQSSTSGTATINGTVDVEDAAAEPGDGLELRIDIQNDAGTEVESQTVTLPSNESTADYSFDVDPANFSGSTGDSAVLADINRDNVSNDEDYSLNTSGGIGDDTEAGRALDELNASETQTKDFTVLAAASDVSVTARDANSDANATTVAFNGTLNEDVSEFVVLNVSQNSLTESNITDVTATTTGSETDDLSASGLIDGTSEIDTTTNGEFEVEIQFADNVSATENFEVELFDGFDRISEDRTVSDGFSVDTTPSG